MDSLEHPPRHHSPRQHNVIISHLRPAQVQGIIAQDSHPRKPSSNYANSTASVDSREHYNRSVSDRQSVTSNADSIYRNNRVITERRMAGMKIIKMEE